jgi:hypothetical protein
MKFVVKNENGCWIWNGVVHKRGYGKFGVGVGNKPYAHRFSYEHFKGPIPPGLAIDHLCSVPLCVNPAHLEAVTTAENNRRSRERGRYAKH